MTDPDEVRQLGAADAPTADGLVRADPHDQLELFAAPRRAAPPGTRRPAGLVGLVPDDEGLYAREVCLHSGDKAYYVRRYADIVATAMRGKWRAGVWLGRTLRRARPPVREGPGYRPVRVEWLRELRDACERAGVAFFFKQWGGRTPKSGGRELDGATYDAIPGVQLALVG